MGLLDTIRSILGLDDGSDRRTGPRSTDVRMEHDPDEPTTVDAGSEAAVKGTDAAASTGSLVEEPDEPGEAAEPAEAAGPTPDDPGTGTDAGATEGIDADGMDPDDESVRVISGIGQAYGKRLADAGVGSVADLAEADAADLADESGISEKRIADWQASARERLDG
ncbi:MAG: helix-hairpin-helix domain-containing protein [Haloarculaceae archaeon]